MCKSLLMKFSKMKFLANEQKMLKVKALQMTQPRDSNQLRIAKLCNLIMIKL